MCEVVQHINWHVHICQEVETALRKFDKMEKWMKFMCISWLTPATGSGQDMNWSSVSLFSLDSGFRDCPEDPVLWERNSEASGEQPIERLPAHSAGNSCSSQCFWEVRTAWRFVAASHSAHLCSAAWFCFVARTKGKLLRSYLYQPALHSSQHLCLPVVPRLPAQVCGRTLSPSSTLISWASLVQEQEWGRRAWLRSEERQRDETFHCSSFFCF